jgi:hypothetical protein
MRVSLAEVLEFVCGRVVCWAEEEAGKERADMLGGRVSRRRDLSEKAKRRMAGTVT